MPVMRKTNLQCSTSDTFYGWNVSEIWKREHEKWITRSQLNRYTSNTFLKLEESLHAEDFGVEAPLRPTICQEVFWSYDGSSLLAVFNDTGIRQYLIPPETNSRVSPDFTDNLESHTVGNDLVPFQRFFKNKSIVSCEVNPRYSPYNTYQTENSILLASRDLPLQLYSLNLGADAANRSRDCHRQFCSKPAFSYDTTTNDDHTNEELLTPFSIQFLNTREFITGSKKNTIRLYDMTRKQPIWTLRSTRAECGSSFANKAIVSCFNEYPTGKQYDINANYTRFKLCGTYKGEIYGIDTRSASFKCVYKNKLKLAGGGIYQLLESENGHFVYCIQRRSNVIDIIDVRSGFKKINSLRLPFTISQQKFKASCSEYYGLTIGTPNGCLLTWSRDMVEFGGLERNADIREGQPRSSLPPDVRHTLSMNTCGSSAEERKPNRGLRINLVSYNPSDLRRVAVSYSPDKREVRKLVENDDTVCHSGVAVHSLG